MKQIAAAVTLALCAATVFAAVSKSYKDWPRTPIGYYLTNAERKQWDALQTDAEAEQFIKDFIARRGGETFTREVAQNAEKADKYLTVGKTPGSETVRGKMMILLGPAVPTSATKKKQNGQVRLAPASTLGGLSSPSMEDMQAATSDPGNSTLYTIEYIYTYPASALPPAYGKPLTVKIEVDPEKDRDRVVGAGEKELDKLYEMVAQAKLAAAKQ